MTMIVATLSNAAVEFESAGQFIGLPGWIHEKRILESFELIFVTRGVLPLNVGTENLQISQGEIMLIPPESIHMGSEHLVSTLEFFWVHFRLQSWHRSSPNYDTPSTATMVVKTAACTIALPLMGTPMNTNRLTVMFDQLLDIYQMSYPNPSFYCNYFTACLLCEVASLAQLAGDADDKQRKQHTLQKVREWIRINAFEDISVNRIAEQFHYSPSYLSTIYKQHFGISITTQISKIRVEHAQEMLLQGSMSVQQVAETCGYDDAKYFMRVFKQHTGLTPTNYRKSFTMRHFNNQ